MSCQQRRKWYAIQRKHQQSQRQYCVKYACIMCCCSMLLISSTLGWSHQTGLAAQPAQARELIQEHSTIEQQCSHKWNWPLSQTHEIESKIVSNFDNPRQPWLPGHRGVDFLVNDGDVIVSPSKGSISFVGTVANKNVVSLHIENVTVTFEPAVSDLTVGTVVEAGQQVATVKGHSDHCDNRCMHWGVKTSQHRYIDPLSKVHAHRIVLKPELT